MSFEKHPDFTSIRANEFDIMSHTYDGEGVVKSKGDIYLPRPSGFADDTNGNAFYKAYKNRAQFPDILAPTVSAMVGIIHAKGIEIKVPTSMEYLLENATKDRLTLDAFHRRITTQILKAGRYAILADAPSGGGDPYLCGYAGQSVINWQGDGSFYVIDDSGKVREKYAWKDQEKYIILQLEGGGYKLTEATSDNDAGEEITPTMSGGKVLDRIPLVVANAHDISDTLVTPPLIGVARAAIAIYQLSADYRHQLFMSGQETLVAINGAAPTQIGAGVAHSMEGAEGITPDLKYVSPSCSGIAAHKIAIDDNQRLAITSGAKLLDQVEKGVNESGKSRALRFSSETATLSSIAKVSCEALEKALRNAAMMLGLSEAQQNEITVRPPESLMDTTMTPQDAKTLVEAWQANGFSHETLYENLQRGGIANPDRAFDEELALMDDDLNADENEQDETA